MPIKIIPIQTGLIRVRPAQFTQPIGNTFLRLLRFLTDRTWSEPIPIYCFLICHPTHGNILFDLGETPRCLDPGYYPWWHIGQHVVDPIIKANQSLGSQLRVLGYDGKKDIRTVVLSHLHSDHAGGLEDVHGGGEDHGDQEVKIYTSLAHWDAFKSPLYATMAGGNPRAWPKGFEPSILDPSGPPVGPWTHTYPITNDGRIYAVDTPGHVPGHVSLVIEDDDGISFLLTGDAVYNMENLDQERIDGITTDQLVALESVKKLKAFCTEGDRKVVVLPSHDFSAIENLRDRKIYKSSL